MGLCNASALLQALQLELPYAFRLTDTVIPENNGVFNFRGKPSAEAPVFGNFRRAFVTGSGGISFLC